MAQIFISYKRVNKDKVFSLVSEIEKKVGCKCWVDLDGIESSAQFASVICRAIDNAEVVLFMHSSVHLSIDFESDWTIKELNYAQMKKKRVVLVKLDNAPLDNIFLMEYGSKNNIDSQDSTQFEKLLKDLRSWVGVASTVQPVQKPLACVTAEEKKLCDEYVELVRRDSYSLRDGVLSGKVLKLAQQGKTEAEYAYGFGLACHGITNLKNLYPDKYRDAVLWVKKAADKEHTKAQALLAEVYYYGNEYENALSYAEDAANKSDYDASVLLYKIYRFGFHDMANYMKFLEKAALLQIKLNKRDVYSKPTFEYGEELLEGNYISIDLNRALYFLNYAIELCGSGDTLYYKAKALYELGEKKQAIETLDKHNQTGYYIDSLVENLRKEIIASMPAYMRIFMK